MQFNYMERQNETYFIIIGGDSRFQGTNRTDLSLYEYLALFSYLLCKSSRKITPSTIYVYVLTS